MLKFLKFKNRKNEEKIEQDPFKKWNPDNKTEKDIEIYEPSMAKDIFENTYAYKIYKESNENLIKSINSLLNININNYFTMYYDLALELSCKNNQKNDDIEDYLLSYEKNNVSDFNTDIAYRTSLVTYAQKVSSFYYNILDIKLLNDLNNKNNDSLKEYIESYVKESARFLFLNKETNIFGKSIRYSEEVENRLLDLFLSMLEYTKKDMPYQKGDKEFVKKEKVIRMCMENMGILEFFDDLKKSIYEAEKSQFD